ncbi:sigma-70 family RNA polymerase sigma factor [Candidatus Sumerlaeota bacterium]|nr:sigma-70 family RNA polymerase sigma factor [Candidatus Sumerlaeota bacterium]
MTGPTTKSNISDPETWIDQHGDYLFRFAMSRLRNEETAQDIVQETLLAAIRARDNFSGKSTERTWLTGIMKHKIVDYIRKAQRERPASEFESDEQDVDFLFDQRGHWKDEFAPAEWNANPAELMERKQFWEQLDRCLGKLPERLSQAFSLRMIDGMKTEEICKVLDVTPTNLWVMLHRSRARLRGCLEQNWFGHEGDEGQ